MSETIKVGEFATLLLHLAQPLSSFDMPLLDAHGATLAEDVTSGERVVLKAGSRIRATQIGLAASLGLDHLPTRPQPRVVVISAGADLVEPGQSLESESEEYEANSWLLTTAMREAGAVSYRVHTIPETADSLRSIVEDQLVRADLIVICGESHDDSFELIRSAIENLGDVKAVQPLIEASGRHAYGTIGPDKTPVVVLPGDPIAAYISCELFIRPMVRSMMGLYDIHRPVIKATLTNNIESDAGKHAFIRGVLSQEKNGERTITALESQGDLAGLSDATGLIILNEEASAARSGDEVDVLLLERRLTRCLGVSKNSWPLELREGDLTLRSLRFRDRSQWLNVRRANREWLSPWEATSPLIEESKNLPTFYEMVMHHNREGRAGRSLTLAIWFDQQLIGQITLGGLSYGAYRGGHIGYWISKEFANRGLTTRAVREMTRHGIEELRLHRIEIALRPENGASKRVAEKSGYIFEGLRPRYLHIDGSWRDHIVFVKENPRI